MKKNILLVSIVTLGIMLSPRLSFADELCCIDEAQENIVQFIEKTRAECAQIIYKLVQCALADNSLQGKENLYQQFKYIFVSKPMKQVVGFGSAYSSVARLYEEAAQVARHNNDIDAVVVLHIAAEEIRRPRYKYGKLLLAAVLGVSVPLICYSSAAWKYFSQNT